MHERRDGEGGAHPNPLPRTHPPQSAIITHDYDISAQRRKDEPEFYGFIPDGVPGAIVFACMVLNSALLLLARSASAALLMLVQPSLFLCYVLGDCAFFFLQKAARGDIRSFYNLDGWVGTVLYDFVLQLIYKLIVDYTGLVQFRGPGCLGGCYWTGNMVRERASEASAKTVLLLPLVWRRPPLTLSCRSLRSCRAGPGPRRPLRRRRHLLRERRLLGQLPRRVRHLDARLLPVRRMDRRLPPLPPPHELLPPPHLLLHADVQGVGVQLLHQGRRQ